MSTGIRTKQVLRGSKQFDEHAKRYIFYPLANIDLAGSQASSPCWITKVLKGRIMLLESFEYMIRGDDPEYEVAQARAGKSPLIPKTMGTDAQVSFLMGTNDGAGFMERGMVQLESITDVDAETVAEIEFLILGNEQGDIETPEDLVAFKEFLESKKFTGDNPVAEKAEAVRQEMLKAVRGATNYCNMQTIVLEKELNEGKAGRMGIRSLDVVQQRYFTQIRKSLPDDRAGVNQGNELAKVLAPLVQAAGLAPQTPPTVSDSFTKELELVELQKRAEAQDAIIAEQAATLKALAEAEDE